MDCCYDLVVKRRGPDKNPGGRVKNRELREKRASGAAEDSTRRPASFANDGRTHPYAGGPSNLSYHSVPDMGRAPPSYSHSVSTSTSLPSHGPATAGFGHLTHNIATDRNQSGWRSVPSSSAPQGQHGVIEIEHTSPVGATSFQTPIQIGAGSAVSPTYTQQNVSSSGEPPLTLEEAKRVLDFSSSGNPHSLSEKHPLYSSSLPAPHPPLSAWGESGPSPTGGSKMGLQDLVSDYQDIMNQAEFMGRTV